MDISKYGTPVNANSPTVNNVGIAKYGTPLNQSEIDKLNAHNPNYSGSGVGEFVKSLVSAPLTMVARPVQAVAELLGASAEDVNKVSDKISGGLIAPVPQNISDVKKDVGRAVQTVALGTGPVSGGVLFGVGSSLEQGNDLLSVETALQGVLGAGAGKVLGLIGKPVFNAAGKVIGKVTPQYLKELTGKGASAIADFAASHNILPENIAKPLNTAVQSTEQALNKPFDIVGSKIKSAVTSTPQDIVNKRAKEIFDIENNYVGTRKSMAYSKDANNASRQRIASTDVLNNSVDQDGLLRTQNAYNEYKKIYLDGAENLVRNNLEREGSKVSVQNIKSTLRSKILSSGLEGKALKSALNNIDSEIEGLMLRANPDGTIPTSILQDAKISTTSGIDFNTEAFVKTERKAIANAYKTLVEENSNLNIKQVNEELSKYLKDLEIIKSLDGKRVKGGKLGKYFAQISGNIVGGAVGGAIGGPVGAGVGTIVGGELGGRIRGNILSKKLSGKTGNLLPKSKIIEESLLKSKSPRLMLPSPSTEFKRQFVSGPTINLGSKTQTAVDEAYSKSLGNRKVQYIKAKTKSNNSIPKTVAKKKVSVKKK